MRMELRLRFDDGRVLPWVRREGGDVIAVAGPDAVALRTPVQLEEGEQTTTVADFSVGEGFQVPFVLTWHASHLPTPLPLDPLVTLAGTEAFWRDWVGRCT